MLSLHTNTSSQAAMNALDQAGRAQALAATRLGTGYRINSAVDDAAGLQIATRLAAQVSGTQTAMRNLQNGISLMQVADGVAESLTSLFTRMQDLALQAADASSSNEDKLALQTEFSELYRQAWQVRGTRYNGESLMVSRVNDPAKFDAKLTMQTGADGADTLTVDFTGAMAQMATGFQYSDPTDLTDILTKHASQAVTDMAGAIDAVAQARSQFGAVSNRLESAYRAATNLVENTTVARGRIVDTDFATESAEATSQQMLMQSSTAMLKQSGSLKQLTISLLQ